MARLCGACCGLFLFGAILLIGVYEGVTVERVMLRAIAGLFGGLALGMVVGGIGTCIVRDKPASSKSSPNNPNGESEDNLSTMTTASRS